MSNLPEVRYQQLKQPKVASMRSIIAGPFDTGKTSLAAGASLHEDMSPVLFLDVDRRLTTLAETDGILYADMPDVATASRIVRDLSGPRTSWPAVIRNARTIVLDSVTMMRDKTLHEFAAEKAAGGGHMGTEFLYEERDYGYASNVVFNLIDKLIQTGNHVIILAHTKEHFNEDGTLITRIEPALNTRLKNLLGGMMHGIWYTKRTKPEEFRLLVLERHPYMVKTTHPVFKSMMKDLTEGQVTVPTLEELKKQGLKEAEAGVRIRSAQELKVAATGWLKVPYVPDSLPNTLPMLWDYYKQATKDE